jgi:hypothetical protein
MPPSAKTKVNDHIYFDDKVKFSDWNTLGITHAMPGVNDEYIAAVKNMLACPESPKSVLGFHFYPLN